MPNVAVLVFLWPHFCRYEEKVVFQGAKPKIDSFPTKTEVKLRQLISAEK